MQLQFGSDKRHRNMQSCLFCKHYFNMWVRNGKLFATHNSPRCTIAGWYVHHDVPTAETPAPSPIDVCAKYTFYPPSMSVAIKTLIASWYKYPGVHWYINGIRLK